MKEYEKCGECRRIDDDYAFKPDWSGGWGNGCIFKDEEAYEKDWDAPCYVPEHAFDDAEEIEDGWKIAEYYTHNSLLELCDGNRHLCDALFGELDWCYPETKYNELDSEDFADFYDFVKPGAKVWWNDPDDGLSSGVYEVIEIKAEPDELDSDTIVLIGNGSSEAEVFLTELTPVYPDLIMTEPCNSTSKTT